MYGRQAGSNQGQQTLRKKGNLTPYARVPQWMCTLSWVPACSQFIITIIIQDVCVHTGAISRDVRSLKEYIVLYTSALAEQFTTIHGFTQGGCCPHRSHYQSSQAAAGVNLQGEDLFWWFLFVGRKIFGLFENRHYYYKGNGDEMKICLRWNSAKQYVEKTILATES